MVSSPVGRKSGNMKAEWITSNRINDKNNMLPPELFCKVIDVKGEVSSATLTISALGIYMAELNGKKVGDAFFTPGYTHYESYVQSQTYDVTEMLNVGQNIVDITVANGWWLGTICKKNNNYGKKRAVIAELLINYLDGSTQSFSTDTSWKVTDKTAIRFSDFYDGETIDLRFADREKWVFDDVNVYSDKLPELIDHVGTYVRVVKELEPTLVDESIYDFGQNHAGLIRLIVHAKRGTVIKIRHAEILDTKGALFTKNLRKAKQILTFVCGTDGLNVFEPGFTFMGFRYAEVTGDKEFEIISLVSRVVSSDCEEIGFFNSSDDKLNRLYENTKWGQLSNFIEIPTDCPQRDERLGWTGDIAVFVETASMHRNIHDFMRKWLKDLRLYQRKNGTIPVTIPENKTYNPTPFEIPIAIWGDAATMVPWAVYKAYGDLELLKEQYASMKAYVEAELKVAKNKGVKYLWDKNWYQYGDWCAPGESYTKWLRKGKYLSTAFMANSVRIVRDSAFALGIKEDVDFFADEFLKIRKAFKENCILPDGKLKGDFASNYVCALYFDLVPIEKKALLAKRLSEIVRENDYRITTGFAGTPYLLFALADNGYGEDAYNVLLNEACPGWLYTVNAGATTMWERWDALNEDGSIKAGTFDNMVSFNHYAYGSVGAFYYRRVLGIEAMEPGYKKIRVAPVLSERLEWANGSINTAFGEVAVSWKHDNGNITFHIKTPVKTVIALPGENETIVDAGEYDYIV